METTAKRENVGKSCVDILTNPNLDTKQSLMDTSNEMSKEILPQIEECINRHSDWTEPFYVVIINKRERLMINAIRQYFLARKTLPTTDYDQTVFKYTPSTGDLKYLWTLPDKNTIDYLVMNEIYLPLEQSKLVEFCKLFKAGTLDTVYGE